MEAVSTVETSRFTKQVHVTEQGSTQIVAVSIAETLGFTKLGKTKQLGSFSVT